GGDMRRRSETLSKAAERRKKLVRARVRGPVVNPRSIDLALFIWMCVPDLESDESQKGLSLLEGEITKHRAESALKDLVKAGCDRAKLLHCLGLACGSLSFL